MARLCAAGTTPLLTPPVTTFEANLDWLSHGYPKFAEVVESGIRLSLQTAATDALAGDWSAEQEAVAFVGAVARVLDLPFFRVDEQRVADPTCRQPSAVITALAFGTDSHTAAANPIGLANLGRMRTPSEVQTVE